MTQSLALRSSTQNSEKLNQAGFNFSPGVIIPVYLTVQWNGLPTELHSHKRHKLDAICVFYRPAASCQQVAASLLTCCNLIFADLLQVAETTFIALVDKKS